MAAAISMQHEFLAAGSGTNEFRCQATDPSYSG